MRRLVPIGGIILLAIGLAIVLIIRPWESETEEPRFEDRLPMSDIIGRTNVLDLAQDLLPASYNNQISFRDFVTPEFILSQGKINGLDLQQPVYFFGSQSQRDLEKWGVMIHVSDSSKVFPGIKRFEKMTIVKDSSLFNERIFICPEYDITIGYGHDWLLITDRKSFKKYFDHVIHARTKGIYPRWRRFIEEQLYSEKSLRCSVISNDLKKYGISSVLLAASADSTSITLHTCISNKDTIPFTLEQNGARYDRSEYTRRLINLSLNIDRLKTEKNHPLYNLLTRAARKVSFPLDEFLKTWNGELSYRQGGLQTIVESYIETELDENFNMTEVVKYKERKISGFALQLSMNDNRQAFIQRLYSKGILTRDENKVRMLYFPPMKMQAQDEVVHFYTGSFRPTLTADSTQSVLWDFNYTPVLFTIDSLESKTAYGKINIGLSKIVSDKLNQK